MRRPYGFLHAEVRRSFRAFEKTAMPTLGEYLSSLSSAVQELVSDDCALDKGVQHKMIFNGGATLARVFAKPYR